MNNDDDKTGKPKKISIRVHSEPFHNDPEGADAYYLEFGRALILWGRFENHISHALLALYNLPGAKDLRPANIPQPFSDKTKLWRKLFRGIDELSALKEEALSLIADASDSAEDRHVLTHGHFNGFIGDDPLTSTPCGQCSPPKPKPRNNLGPARTAGLFFFPQWRTAWSKNWTIPCLAFSPNGNSFARINSAVKTSPAMAAGIMDTLWSMEDIVKLIDDAASNPGPRGPYKNRNIGMTENL